MDSKPLEGKVAIVTGATSGIGKQVKAAAPAAAAQGGLRCRGSGGAAVTVRLKLFLLMAGVTVFSTMGVTAVALWRELQRGQELLFREGTTLAGNVSAAAARFVAGGAMYKGNDLNELPMRVHLWLENMTRIDLGNYTLRVFHTPGHTSGCISIIESTSGLLFSAAIIFCQTLIAA